MAIANLSGRTVVSSAGTPVVLGAGEIHGMLYIKALAANTGIIEVGDSGTAAASGYQLSAKEELLLYNVEELADIYIDATVNGEGVCWTRLRVR
jgi:hypothetical protein